MCANAQSYQCLLPGILSTQTYIPSLECVEVPSNTASHPSASSSASDANYASQFIHQTHVAHADTSTMMYLTTTPSAVTKVVRKIHTTLSLLTLLLSYSQHWRKQDTSTQTPNWTSKHTYTSDLTPLHKTVRHILQPEPHLPPLLPLYNHWRRHHHHRNHTTPKMSYI